MECPFVAFTPATLLRPQDVGDTEDKGQKPDPKLEEGEFLPLKYAKILPNQLKATPVEDIDNSYSKKESFLIIDYHEIINRFSTQKSLYIFDPFNAFRKFATACILNRIWRTFVTLIILVNCYILTFPDVDILIFFENMLFIVYMLEMCLKIIAMGFVLQKHSYLRNPWNQLDFTVNLLLILILPVRQAVTLPLITGVRPLLRLIRIFCYNRKFRYGFRIITASLKSIFYPLMITFFALFFFAIIAANMFALVPNTVCLSTENRTQDTHHLPRNPFDRKEWYQSDNRSDHATCHRINDNFTFIRYPDEPYEPCPENYTCTPLVHYHQLFGTTSNGHPIVSTLVGVLQLMLRDQWDQLFLMMTGTSGIVTTSVYFMGATFVLCYFCCNLIVAAIVLRCEQLDKEYEWPQKETSTAAEETRPPPDYCRDRIGCLVTHPIFELIITAMLIVYSMVVMVEHHGMDSTLENITFMVYYFSVLWFAFELALKLIAGKQHYWRDDWDRFDFCCLTISVPLSFFWMMFDGVVRVHVFMTLALLPTLRLCRILFFLSMPSLDTLLIGVTKKGRKVGYFLFMALVILFLFAVYGLHTFTYGYVLVIPGLNFQDMVHSFMTTFTTTCGEGVQSFLDCSLVDGLPCLFFFIPLLILGNLVLFPIAGGILLTTLEEDTKVPKFAFAENIKGLFCGKRSSVSQLLPVEMMDRHNENLEVDMTHDEDDGHLIIDYDVKSGPEREEGRLAKFLNQPAVEVFINVIIVLVVISLSAQGYHRNDLGQNVLVTHYILANFFLLIILIEMILRLVAFGCKAFFTDFWSLLFFFVAFGMLADLLILELGVGRLQLVMAFPSLFLLRVIRSFCRFKDVKLIVDTFVISLLPSLTATITGALIWYFFAGAGVVMFAGRFFRCVDKETGEVISQEEVWDMQHCLLYNSTNAIWTNPTFNFDHMLNSYLSLLQVATFRGWLDIINRATDSWHLGYQPYPGANIYAIYYFVVFVLVASFFTLKFYLLVIVDVYRKQRKAMMGNIDMSRAEETYYVIKDKISSRFGSDINFFPKQITEPLEKIVASNWFEAVSIVTIGLNLILLAVMSFYTNSSLVFALSLLLVLVFAIEISFRVTAIGWRRYIGDTVNNIDILFAILTVIWLISLLGVKTLPLQGLLRVARFFHLVQLLGHKLPDLRIGLITLRSSIKPLLIVFAFLLTVNVIYSIFAIIWFSDIRLRINGITELVNMRTFGNSFLLMFQLSTTSGWDKILTALGEETECHTYDYNEPDVPHDCGHFIFALIFIISYIIISYFIIFNISVAIVIDNYRLAYDTLEAGFSDHDLDECLLVWRQYDPTGSEHIPVERLTDLVAELKGSFRLDKPNEIKLAALSVDIDTNGVTLKALLEGYLRLSLLKGQKPRSGSQTTGTKKREDFCAKVIQRNWIRYRKEKETV